MIQFILAGNGTQAVPRICCVGGDGLRTILFLRRRIQHVFDKDAVAHCGIIDENVGRCADELAVLNDGTAAHADVK